MKLIFILGVFLYIFTLAFFEFVGLFHAFNIIAVFFLLFYVYRLIKLEGDFSSVAIFFIFNYVVTAIICCMAEFGGYFTEIGQFSYLTGATARNSYLAFLTLHFAYISFNFSNRMNFQLKPMGGAVKHVETILVASLYVSVISVLFFIGVKYGHPNDYGVDRFYYWNNIAPKWGQSLAYFAEICMIFLGRKYALTRKKIYVFMFLIGLLSFYMTGDKFTGFINSIVLFCVPIFIFSSRNLSETIFNKKIIFYSLSAFALFLGTIYLSYYFIYSGDAAKAIEMIMVRLYLQAQMWWGVDSISNLYPKDLNIIWQSFFGFFSEPDQAGIYFLMKQIAPVSVYYTMLEEGVAFTMAYPPNLTYFFGEIISPLLACGCGLIMGAILSIFYKTIKNGSAILLPMATAIYYGAVQSFLMGRLYHLVSIRFLLSFFIIIFFILLSNSKGFKSNKI